MTLSELRAAESEWWFPKVIDTAYCDRLRRDYPEDADLDDDSIREKYGCTGKYNKPSLWDHTGDAEEDYERLADEYLKLRDHILSTVRDDDGEPVTELDRLRAENASLRKQAETNHTLRAELAAAREELAQTPPTLEWLEKTLGVSTIIHTWKGINDCYEWRSAVRWYRGHLRCTDIHGVTLTTRAAVLAAVEPEEA